MRQEIEAFADIGTKLLAHTSKGSDDEPRDDHGRWTSGGGGDDVVDQHVSRLKETLGTDKFGEAFEGIKGLTREQVNQVASKFVSHTPASHPKNQSLQRIMDRHSNMLDSQRKREVLRRLGGA